MNEKDDLLNALPPIPEGWLDCMYCGLLFDPRHPSQKPPWGDAFCSPECQNLYYEYDL